MYWTTIILKWKIVKRLSRILTLLIIDIVQLVLLLSFPLCHHAEHAAANTTEQRQHADDDQENYHPWLQLQTALGGIVVTTNVIMEQRSSATIIDATAVRGCIATEAEGSDRTAVHEAGRRICGGERRRLLLLLVHQQRKQHEQQIPARGGQIMVKNCGRSHFP